MRERHPVGWHDHGVDWAVVGRHFFSNGRRMVNTGKVRERQVAAVGIVSRMDGKIDVAVLGDVDVIESAVKERRIVVVAFRQQAATRTFVPALLHH